jgi:hypothetical protein
MDKIDDLTAQKAERATGIIFKNIELPGKFEIFEFFFIRKI